MKKKIQPKVLIGGTDILLLPEFMKWLKRDFRLFLKNTDNKSKYSNSLIKKAIIADGLSIMAPLSDAKEVRQNFPELIKFLYKHVI